MDVVCFQHDGDYVLERFRKGEFDFVDAASEVFETEFFRFIGAEAILQELAASYPSPRRRHDVPVWFFIASNLAMRFHISHSFSCFPYVVRCGGMLNVFGPEVGHKTTHPDTGDVTLACKGFNDKNDYDRQTPCDQDFLRKFSRDTDSDALLHWFNRKVSALLKERGAFDEAGIFIGDASYVFVPDNERYEGSSVMRFDENDKPVSQKRYQAMTPAQRERCQWRRCYKLISVLHTDRRRSFCLKVAARLVEGKASESAVLYDLVDELVAALGPGVVKRLILDRGFIDGAQIGRMKIEHGIHVLVPLRSNMLVYEDAMGLLKSQGYRWRRHEVAVPERSAPSHDRPRPKAVERREQKRQKTLQERAAENAPPPAEKTVVRSDVAVFANNDLWESCPLPVNVIVNRDRYADGHEEHWVLVDTKPLKGRRSGSERREEYALRTEIEERYRQLKCFWDLPHFTSTKLSLIIAQVVFIFLTHNLLQWYLRRRGRADLNRKTPQRLRDQLIPAQTVVIIYCDDRFATLSVGAFAELCITLPEEAKPKALRKLRAMRRQQESELANPRPP